jgi:hypothetical protein
MVATSNAASVLSATQRERFKRDVWVSPSAQTGTIACPISKRAAPGTGSLSALTTVRCPHTPTYAMTPNTILSFSAHPCSRRSDVRSSPSGSSAVSSIADFHRFVEPHADCAEVAENGARLPLHCRYGKVGGSRRGNGTSAHDSAPRAHGELALTRQKRQVDSRQLIVDRAGFPAPRRTIRGVHRR